mgnify:CR=1 FL=1
MAVEDEFSDSHYMKQHWAKATTETPVRICDVKEPVVALIDRGSEINLMLMDFYKKGMIGIDSLRSARPQPSSRFMHRKQKIQMNKEETQDVYVETQMWEKTTAAHKLQNTL